MAKWTSTRVSNYAARTFFFLVFLQIPLFRVPCRSGTCTTPMHVTCSQLFASDIIPVGVVKALLYPGAVVHGVVKSRTLPSWGSLVDTYNLTSVKESPAVADLKRLEVLAGSYFAVAGGLIGILKPGRMSMFGTLLIVWGLVKEGFLKPSSTDATESIYVYPTMLLAIVCAFASVKYDIKKAMKQQAARPVAKPLQSSSKSKLKCSCYMMAGPSSSGEPKSIEEQLKSLLVVHSDCCIYVVPENLRKVNEDAYRPLLVSIGPVYYGEKNLADMQHQKLRYLQSFLKRYPKYSLQDYLAIAKEWEVRAKRSYIETIKLPNNSQEFVEMLLIDAAFLIELFMRNCTPDTIGPDDRIYNKPRRVVEIRRDIRLEENQLPFFILRDLYTRATESPSQQPHPSLLDVTCRFFNIGAVPEGINLNSIDHLVGFLRECHLPSPPQRRGYRAQSACNNQELKFTSSVTRLSEAGVKFVASENGNLVDIKFSEGVLEIPKLKLTDDLESLFRNIMAFEQCHHYSDSYFIDYVAFLNCLINTPEDVDILAKKEIIDNWLGNSEEVANLFSKLFKETRMMDANFYYSGICRDLNAYSKTRWPRWRAILKRNSTSVIHGQS